MTNQTKNPKEGELKKHIKEDVEDRHLTIILLKICHEKEKEAISFLKEELTKKETKRIDDLLTEPENVLGFLNKPASKANKEHIKISLEILKKIIEFAKTKKGKEIIREKEDYPLSKLVPRLFAEYFILNLNKQPRKEQEKLHKYIDSLLEEIKVIKKGIEEQKKQVKDIKDKSAKEAHLLIWNVDQKEGSPPKLNTSDIMKLIDERLKRFDWTRDPDRVLFDIEKLAKETEKRIMNQKLNLGYFSDRKGIKRSPNAHYRAQLINVYALAISALHAYCDDYIKLLTHFTNNKNMLKKEEELLKKLIEDPSKRDELNRTVVTISEFISEEEERVIQIILNQLHRLKTHLTPEMEKYASKSGFNPTLENTTNSQYPTSVWLGQHVTENSANANLNDITQETKSSKILIGSSQTCQILLPKGTFKEEEAELEYKGKTCTITALKESTGIIVKRKAAVVILLPKGIKNKESKQELAKRFNIGSNDETSSISKEINTFISNSKKGVSDKDLFKKTLKLEDDDEILISNTGLDSHVLFIYHTRSPD